MRTLKDQAKAAVIPLTRVRTMRALETLFRGEYLESTMSMDVSLHLTTRQRSKIVGTKKMIYSIQTKMKKKRHRLLLSIGPLTLRAY